MLRRYRLRGSSGDEDSLGIKNGYFELRQAMKYLDPDNLRVYYLVGNYLLNKAIGLWYLVDDGFIHKKMFYDYGNMLYCVDYSKDFLIYGLYGDDEVHIEEYYGYE